MRSAGSSCPQNLTNFFLISLSVEKSDPLWIVEGLVMTTSSTRPANLGEMVFEPE